MVRLCGSVLAAACLGTSQLSGQDTLPEPIRQARALIAAGNIEDAIHTSERYTLTHPRDERGFLALGDAWFHHMPTGRFRAAQAYEAAERLAPRDAEPPYQYAQVGLWLGGDDGEGMAKQGLERVLALDPLYRDAWDEWLTLFRNGGSRRHVAEMLAPHRDDPVIRSRLALLAIEEERYGEANRLLDSALAADSTNTAWLALRAQSAFEAGDTATGWAFYGRALAHADQDSTDALWHQVVGIAWPYEVRLWEAGVPPDRKEGWLESFWARRNPNLFAGVNDRVAEHFARLRYARKNYPLLHPLISYHRNQIARAMNLEPSEGEREYYQRCEMYEVLQPAHLHKPYPEWAAGCGADPECLAAASGVPLPTVSSASDRARIGLDPWARVTDAELDSYDPKAPVFRDMRYLSLNMDLRSMDSVAARVGYNLATGLDDRGVMYLRFGPPDRQYVGGKNPADPRCSVTDVQRWDYAEYGEVRFARPSAFSKGERNVPDMVFRAMNERQFAAVQTGLTRDASSEPAPLEFGIWTAQFADSAENGTTDVVVVSTRGAVAASLEAPSNPGGIWISHTGSATVRSEPGPYVLVAQARDSGLLGRQTLALTVRAFERAPVVSDLLLAPAWEETSPTRAGMLAHLHPTLVFARGSTIRTYAEVYGLQVDSGTVRYRVEYVLLKTDVPERDIRLETWPRATTLAFQRFRAAARAGIEIETLDIVPSQVPPGRYLLRVRIQDLVTGADAGRATISFAVQ
jgi:cytochrome c-type biogenesis protein CcmH/NrfG